MKKNKYTHIEKIVKGSCYSIVNIKKTTEEEILESGYVFVPHVFIEPLELSPNIIIGIDFAESGNDYSVYAIIKNGELVFSSPDYETICEKFRIMKEDK